MPAKLEAREGETYEVRGASLTLAYARGGRCVWFVAGYDEAGLLETEEDTRSAAKRWKSKLDKAATDDGK